MCVPCVSVCLAAVFLILGVDVLEDKGPIELSATDACSLSAFVLKDGVFRDCSRADLFFFFLFFLRICATGSLLIFAVSYPRAVQR